MTQVGVTSDSNLEEVGPGAPESVVSHRARGRARRKELARSRRRVHFEYAVVPVDMSP